MRKRWLYFLILFVLIISILYVWRYNQSQVFEKRVPAFATKVVNVNLRQIENHLLFDFLTNPITYLKPRKKKDSIKKPKFSLTKGVRIPKNILFYTNADNLDNNWFSSVVEVSDPEELSRFLLKEKFKKTSEENIVLFTKSNLILAIKKEQLVCVFKTNSNINAVNRVNDLFGVKEYLNADDSLLKEITKSESDICFSLENSVLEANFRNGVFELQGLLNEDVFLANTNEASNRESVGIMSGQINKNNASFKKVVKNSKHKFDELTHLSLDSIIDKWNGEFKFNITSIEHKTDTIISYEYDEDFNKIETKTTQDKKIPTLSLVLGQEPPTRLSNYFYSKNAIQIIEEDTVFTKIPVFKFLATNTENDIALRVNGYSQPVQSLTESKFNFYVNVEKYFQSPLDIPLNKDQEKFLKLIKNTEIDWAKDNRFVFKINLINKSRNFLGQFVKN